MSNQEKSKYSPEAWARRVEKNREASRRNTRAKREYVWNYRAARGCVDCGEDDPVVLDLDHRDPSEKVHKRWFNFTWPQLYAELEKCDVRCANCHRRKTAAQQGWPRG